MKQITVRNVPDDVYRSLKALAETNRRSLQQQALILLERVRALDQPTLMEDILDLRARLADLPQGDVVADVREDRQR